MEVLRPVPVGQVDQHGEAGRAFDEGPDGGAVADSDDAVALPVSWDGAIGGFGGPVADHQHGSGVAGLALVGLPVRLAHGPARSECTGEFTAKFASALDVEGLVDRLVGHVHLRAVGEAPAQSAADLLRAPALGEAVLDEVPQFRALSDLARLRPRSAGVSATLGGVWPIVGLAIGQHGAVATYLPADGRGAAAQLGGDRADGGLLPRAVGYVNPLSLRQET